MLIALAVLSLQTKTEYLVVDGLLVGVHGYSGWARPRAWGQQVRLPFSDVTSEGNPITLTLGASRNETAVVVLDRDISGVFYSGKTWTPRVPEIALNRNEALAEVRQFARNFGVAQPQPYLTGVWDVNLDQSGSGQQIIEAVSNSRVRRGQAQAGDWQAVLLLARHRERKDRLYPLHFSFPKPGQALADCRLRAVADFDGDGLLEIVTTSRQSNMLAVTLWSFADDKLVPTLDATYQVDAMKLGQLD